MSIQGHIDKKVEWTVICSCKTYVSFPVVISFIDTNAPFDWSLSSLVSNALLQYGCSNPFRSTYLLMQIWYKLKDGQRGVIASMRVKNKHFIDLKLFRKILQIGTVKDWIIQKSFEKCCPQNWILSSTLTSKKQTLCRPTWKWLQRAKNSHHTELVRFLQLHT